MARISARAVPVLEVGDGRLLRFDHGRTTDDGAYFAEPPWAFRPDDGPLSGVLRVSLCRAGERACSIVALPVRLGREPPWTGGRT